MIGINAIQPKSKMLEVGNEFLRERFSRFKKFDRGGSILAKLQKSNTKKFRKFPWII